MTQLVYQTDRYEIHTHSDLSGDAIIIDRHEEREMRIPCSVLFDFFAVHQAREGAPRPFECTQANPCGSCAVCYR